MTTKKLVTIGLVVSVLLVAEIVCFLFAYVNGVIQ